MNYIRFKFNSTTTRKIFIFHPINMLLPNENTITTSIQEISRKYDVFDTFIHIGFVISHFQCEFLPKVTTYLGHHEITSDLAKNFIVNVL